MGKKETTSDKATGKHILREKLSQPFADLRIKEKEPLIPGLLLPRQGSGQALIHNCLLMEGIHFNLIYTPLRHLGYKAVIQAIAPIYAAFGKPEQLTIRLAVSRKLNLSRIEEMLEGVYGACKQHQLVVDFLDLETSLTGLHLSLTACGRTFRKKPVGLDAARPTEIICVSGDLGGAYLGLQVLERERKLFESSTGIQPDLGDNTFVLSRQLMPELKHSILVRLLAHKSDPTAMTITKDGLASDLIHLCRASGTGCRIYSNRIPIADQTLEKAEEFQADPLLAALNGGDDFEFLFTMDVKQKDVINEIDALSIIGFLTPEDEGMYLEGREGGLVELKAPAWSEGEED